jgi:hypothetical protein
VLDKYFAIDSDTTDPARRKQKHRESAGKLAAIALVAAFDAAEPRKLGAQGAVGSPAARTLSSATDEQATAHELHRRLAQVLARAWNEEFREGMPSEFAEELRLLVLDFGTVVVTELQRIIAARAVRPGLGFEALTTLADFKYSSIAADRLRLVEWALSSPAPEIRYGGALALATLRDPKSAAALQMAVAREPLPDLQRALQKVLSAIREIPSVGTAL